jgi:hypothetical protein
MKADLYKKFSRDGEPMNVPSSYELTGRKKRLVKFLPGILLILAFLFMANAPSQAQAKMHADCCDPSFGAITFFYTVQPGSTLGFGMEAGKWNKEASRFSYFLGTRMQWYPQGFRENNKVNGVQDVEKFYLYLKGQCRIVNRLYLEAAPQVLNLSHFEGSAGLRYVQPLGSLIGVGVEPSYLIVAKQLSVSVNVHLAL